MKIVKLDLRAAALLLAVFIIIAALPLADAKAAGTSISIVDSPEQFVEGFSENWQQIGTFTIADDHLPISGAQLIIDAYDVDAPEERDRIRIRKNADDTVLPLGTLTGMDNQNNTNVLDVSASFLTAGSYTLEIDMASSSNGSVLYDAFWVVTIESATLILDGGADENINASVSFTASGTSVETTLLLDSLTKDSTYTIEYKFTNMTIPKQIASATESYTASDTTGEVLKTLTLDAADAIADDAEYRLDVVVTNGANVVTASADRGIITENIGASVSFTATGTAVDTTLLLSSLTGGNTYELAYEFINETKGKLIASASDTYTASGTSGEILKTLTLNAEDAVADDAAYRLNVTVTRGLSTAAATAVKEADKKEEPKNNGRLHYYVTASSNEGGRIDPISRTAVDKNDSFTISFYSDEGYTIKDVKIDGVSMGPLESYTFWRMSQDHKVEVEFMPLVSPPKTGSASSIGFALLALIGSVGCLFVIRRKKELS